MNVRDLLNELQWHPDKRLDDCTITFLHRGAPRDRKSISGAQIVDIGISFLIYRDSKGDDVHIPYHRVMEIRGEDGGLIWGRQNGPAVQENSRTC